MAAEDSQKSSPLLSHPQADQRHVSPCLIRHAVLQQPLVSVASTRLTPQGQCISLSGTELTVCHAVGLTDVDYRLALEEITA